MVYDLQCLASVCRGSLVELTLGSVKKIGVVAGFSIAKHASIHSYKCDVYIDGILLKFEPLTKVRYMGRQNIARTTKLFTELS